MVENSGKTPGVSPYQPVNAPEPVAVKEDASGLPVAVMIRRQQPIKAIDDMWRIDDEWWRSEPISRLYCSIRLASGRRVVIYRDLAGGGWYRQSY